MDEVWEGISSMVKSNFGHHYNDAWILGEEIRTSFTLNLLISFKEGPSYFNGSS